MNPSTSDLARRNRFERLFAGAYEPVQRYVARRAPAAVVDDVVAETFLVVWRRLDDVPEDAELAWCYGVARRTVANIRRGERRRQALVERLAAEPDRMAGGTADPALEQAMAELDPDTRELLRLWAWEGLEPRHLAVALGISANAASIRLHRARRELAGKIEAQAGHSRSGPTREEGTP